MHCESREILAASRVEQRHRRDHRRSGRRLCRICVPRKLVAILAALGRGAAGISFRHAVTPALGARPPRPRRLASCCSSRLDYRDRPAGEEPEPESSRLGVLHVGQLLRAEVGLGIRGARSSPPGRIVPAVRLSGGSGRLFHVRQQAQVLLR